MQENHTNVNYKGHLLNFVCVFYLQINRGAAEDKKKANSGAVLIDISFCITNPPNS